MPRNPPRASIARSPVTMSCASAVSAHSTIRLSGSSESTVSGSTGSTISPRLERKTTTLASSSRSRANFRARTERSSSMMGLERASESSPATIFLSVWLPCPSGRLSSTRTRSCRRQPARPQIPLEISLGQNSPFLRPATPVVLQSAKFLAQAGCPRFLKRILNNPAQSLALDSHRLLGRTGEIEGQRDGLSGGSCHGEIPPSGR